MSEQLSVKTGIKAGMLNFFKKKPSPPQIKVRRDAIKFDNPEVDSIVYGTLVREPKILSAKIEAAEKLAALKTKK